MKTLKRTSLFFLSSFLMACGSGGGGGNSAPTAPTPANETTQNDTATPITDTSNNAGNNTDNSSINNTVNNPPEVTLPNTGNTITQDSFVKGRIDKASVVNGTTQVAELSGYNRQYSFNGALVKTKEKDIEEIIVDGGAKLAIAKVGSVGGLSGIALTSTLNSLFNMTKDPERDVFYFGSETPEADIPKNGIVTYKGNASRYDNMTNSVKNVGKTTLTADFDTKKISGAIAMDGVLRRNLSLKETDIVGNGFSGKATAGENYILLPTRYGTYEGKFYGPNAEEVAGKVTFAEAQKDLNTSFSAEKVE